MHNLFVTEEDMLLVQQRTDALLASHRLQFKPAADANAASITTNPGDMRRHFYDDLYADTYARDIAFFAVKCEQYIDFAPIDPNNAAAHER